MLADLLPEGSKPPALPTQGVLPNIRYGSSLCGGEVVGDPMEWGRGELFGKQLTGFRVKRPRQAKLKSLQP